MATQNYVWPADAFDAISVLTTEAEISVEGTQADEVRLTGGDHLDRDYDVEIDGRWLVVRQWKRTDDPHLGLQLPRRKPWVVEASGWRGRIEVHNVQANLRVQLGRGDVEVKDCQGVFNLTTGNGNVELKDCIEAPMAEPPPQPAADAGQASREREERAGAEEGALGAHGNPGSPWDWLAWDEDEWREWGIKFGRQAMDWGLSLGHMFGGMAQPPRNAGVNIQIGHGDLRAEDLQANACSANLGRGEADLKHGCIAALTLFTGKGDVTCQSILPADDWAFKTAHGDIRVEFPSDTRAKLDVATRHGDIRSDVPLVRVARPGPEARHGGRKVGTVGDVEGRNSRPSARMKIKAGRWVIVDKGLGARESADSSGGAVPVIDLVALNGDINLKLAHARSEYSGAAKEESMQADLSSSPAQADGAAGSAANEIDLTLTAQDQSRSTNGAGAGADPRLIVLQALSEGRISVEQADKLLNSLDS